MSYLFVVIAHLHPETKDKSIQGLPRMTCMNTNNKVNKLTLHMHQSCAHDLLQSGIHPLGRESKRYIASTELRYLCGGGTFVALLYLFPFLSPFLSPFSRHGCCSIAKYFPKVPQLACWSKDYPLLGSCHEMGKVLLILLSVTKANGAYLISFQALVIAGISDLQRPAEKLSLSQTACK